LNSPFEKNILLLQQFAENFVAAMPYKVFKRHCALSSVGLNNCRTENHQTG